MRAAITVACAVALSGCVTLPDDWSRVNTVAEISYQVLNAADAVTTAQIQHDPNVYEAGPIASRILGDNPSNDEIAVYFATLGVSHFLISLALPDSWRAWWQAGTVVYTGAVVVNNCNQNLCD